MDTESHFAHNFYAYSVKVHFNHWKLNLQTFPVGGMSDPLPNQFLALDVHLWEILPAKHLEDS